MTVTLVDPALLGTDVSMIDDVDPVWGIASGYANLARALLRRLSTDRGGLFYDPDYGYNVTDLLNAGMTPRQRAKAQQDITAEVRKDERVRSPRVVLTYNAAFQSLTIDVRCDTPAGPFSMVMAATALTVEILRVNGVAVAEAPAATGSSVVIVAGPPGASVPGPPGPPGPGGSAQLTIDFGDDIHGDDSGAEVVLLQREISAGALPASLTVEISGHFRSDSGTATFRVRLGGGDRAVDGTVIATVTTASATFAELSDTSTFVNPTGLLRLKVTAESSAAAQFGEFKDVVVTLR